ncbi:MAG: CotH kinase family protein [Akkermansiaceae bacterium]
MKTLLATLLFCGPLIASEILTPTSSQLLASSEFFPAANLTNGSGLSQSPTIANYTTTTTHAAASGSSAWTTDAPGGGSADYFALDPATAPLPVFLLTFTEEHEFTDFIYWGYHFGNPNGNEVKSFTLEFSTDGGSNFSNSISLTSPAITQGNATSLPFNDTFPANTIRLTLTDNWFEDYGGGDRAGLGEIRFIGTTPINPDPVIEVPRLIDFGAFASTPGPLTTPLTISKSGGLDDLTLTTNLPDGGPFSVTEEDLIVPSGQSQNLTLTFDSQIDGCFRETLTLSTNDPEHPTIEVTLIAAINCTFPTPEQPGFSREEGIFTDDFLLALTTNDPGSTLIYTLDGSLPTPENGLVYNEVIPITTSTQVRAASYYPGQIPAIRTRSYIRLSPDVAAYSSDLPIMVVENFGAGTIPNKSWNTSTQTGGGLQQVAQQPAFLGVFEKDPVSNLATLNSAPVQTSRIGIRVRGAFSSTWPVKPYAVETWKTDADQDRSIKILGMASDSDWILYFPDANYDRSMLYNTFIWELSRQTGRWAPEFRFVDLFVNQDGGDLTLADRAGVYAFLEKPTRGSKRLDFEKLSDDGTTGGWLNAINRMDAIPIGGFPAENGATTPQFFHTAGRDRIQSTPPNTSGRGDDIPRQYNAFINFEDPNGYKITPTQRTAIEDWHREFEDIFFDDTRWLDPVNGYRQHLNTNDFIDYFQMLTLAKQGDGLLLSMFPWVSSGERKLHMGPMWDFNNGAYSGSTTGTLYFRPDRLWYDRLFEDPAFQREYEDRWFELRRGPLSNANMAAIINRQATEITTNLAGQQPNLTASSWTSRVNTMDSWLQTRADWIDTNFLAPPTFSAVGGIVSPGFTLHIQNPAGQTGTLYYSLDEQDPIDSLLPYDTPLTLNASAQISARLLTPSGDWSAIMRDTFVVGTPANSQNLIVSEINYHPLDESPGTEFIELLNISPDTIDLTNLTFTAGLSFTFPTGALLAPDERILVVETLSPFAGLNVAGVFANETRLSNSGEQLTLTGADGTVIFDLTYHDKDPWPEFADGSGFSLTLIQPTSRPDLSSPLNWRPGLSPGTSDTLTFTGPDLTQHVLGDLSPTLINNSFQYQVILAADDFQVIPQESLDLATWLDLPAPTQPTAISPGGTAQYTLSVPPDSTRKFLRLLVQLKE